MLQSNENNYKIYYDKKTYDANREYRLDKSSPMIFIDSIIIPININIFDYMLVISHGNNFGFETIWSIPLLLLFNVSNIKIKSNLKEYIIQINDNFFGQFGQYNIIPHGPVSYSHINVELRNTKYRDKHTYKILYKHIDILNDKMIKSYYNSRHGFQINTYDNFVLMKHNMIRSNKPITGIYIISNLRLKNVEITCDNLYHKYCSILIDRHMIKEHNYWSNEHGIALEESLKERGVVRGVRNMIKQYCIPKQYKEYTYWLTLDYSKNNDITPSLIFPNNLQVLLKLYNETKTLKGYIIIQQKSSLIVTDGLYGLKQ